MNMTRDLTNKEISQLERCEAVIERGQKTFYEVGMALKTIRDARLYRDTHKTFEEYCRERWGFERAQAYRFIESSSVIANLSPTGDKPKSEREARPLTSLKPSEQVEAWERAVETAPGGKVTAAHVENVVKEYKYEKRTEQEIKPSSVSKFNFTNDNVEWAAWTWNPVTGCKHGCDYCYARDISNRFTNDGFKPTFHESRLDAPCNTAPDPSVPGGCNVFVCSMADLFGEWVPNTWIFDIIRRVADNPRWNFLFLTKNPKRYTSIQFPDNAWIGATVDRQHRAADAERYLRDADAKVKFISCEPMLEPIVFSDMSVFNWVIIGARSKTTSGLEMQPDFGWVFDLTQEAFRSGCKVYWKPNLTARPRQYPVINNEA